VTGASEGDLVLLTATKIVLVCWCVALLLAVAIVVVHDWIARRARRGARHGRA
jgi:hypothetical protein